MTPADRAEKWYCLGTFTIILLAVGASFLTAVLPLLLVLTVCGVTLGTAGTLAWLDVGVMSRLMASEWHKRGDGTLAGYARWLGGDADDRLIWRSRVVSRLEATSTLIARVNAATTMAELNRANPEAAQRWMAEDAYFAAEESAADLRLRDELIAAQLAARKI